MVLAAADASSPYAFDAVKDNLGMVVVAVIVLVTWLAFRRMLELSERKSKSSDAKK
jgi:hypothetical protein